MAKLALKGGEPVRQKPFPKWPVWDERELEALKEVLESGVWGIGGKKQKEFEERFAAYQNAAYGVTVPSGTAALEVALKAAGVGAGDEVIIPAYTFVATASAVIAVNALPVFADVEPDSYTMDAASAERLITPRTKALIPVHIAGRPTDMDAVMPVAEKHGLTVIEDACQAWGAQWRGRGVGSIGHLGCFSFQSSKNITCGEGGIILTNDRKLYETAWSYHNTGRPVEGSRYEYNLLGGNYRMTEFQAAILVVQLSRYEEHLKTRMENAGYLSRRLSEIEGIRPLKDDARITRNAYHLYVFRYDGEALNGVHRDRFVDALRAEGIPCTGGYGPWYRAPYMLALKEDRLLKNLYGERADYSRLNVPVTEKACTQEGVWLFQSMLLGSREDMEDIVAAVDKIRENTAELAT